MSRAGYYYFFLSCTLVAIVEADDNNVDVDDDMRL